MTVLPLNAVAAACGDIRDWQRNRQRNDRLLFGLSAIAIGLDRIERGQNEEGLGIARHGLKFLTKLAEPQGE